MNVHVRAEFYPSIAPFTRFAGVVDPENYHPLPDDWLIGVSDVVNSTGAIAEGRYKAVNMVGAGVISAVRNALPGVEFPFVFGGDGASFAIPSRLRDKAEEALASLQVWAHEEIGLELRAALVPVSAVRAEGQDVLVGRYAPSPYATYAMFSGGGAAWAERQMKRGRFLVPPASPGSRPDLNGLSCRWSPMTAERGQILSVLVVPVGEAGEDFRRLVEKILDLSREEGTEARPIPASGPHMGLWPSGAVLEAKVPTGKSRSTRPLWWLRLTGLLGWLVLKAGVKLGSFDPAHYRSTLIANSDFRKFDDGLKLTLDCSAELAARMEHQLEHARRKGIARYGLHRQAEAIMTCIVPSVTVDDHIHFIDGAAGGYAEAARMLKRQAGPA